MRYASLFIVCAVLCAQVPSLAGAQSNLDYGQAELSLSLSPEDPAPGEVVRIRARSSLADLSGSAITWYVNDTPTSQGRGIVEFQTTAGALGSDTEVYATASTNAGSLISATARIRPTELDLLWEADSYVPTFYRNRALPSAGSKIRLQAIPRFIDRQTLVPVSDIVFTWRRNGYVIASVSGAGRSSVTIDAPSLFGTDIISVDAESVGTGLTGKASARIQTREPVLELYEEHPLFGVLYNRALGIQTSLAEVEKTFIAIPYFAPTVPRGLVFEWEVNGQSIPTDPTRPDEITVNAANSNGLALIELAITSTTNFFLDSYRSWGIALSSSGFNDPFRSQQ